MTGCITTILLPKPETQKPKMKNGNTESTRSLSPLLHPDPVGVSQVPVMHSEILLRRMLQKRWRAMRRRCSNPKDTAFRHYGGRGISVCPEWQNFYAFYAWCVGHGFRAWLTLDRIDNSKGYSPENCRWTDWSTQQSNRRMTPAAARQLADMRAKVDYQAMVRASVRVTSKPVVCVETGRRFKGLSAAARFYKVAPQSIRAAVINNSKTCCGHHWTYAN